MTIGEPDISTQLSVRLLKNWHKYVRHFGEQPLLLRNSLLQYFSEVELDGANMENYDTLKQQTVNRSISQLAEELGEFKIRLYHRETIRRYIFTYPDRRDFMLIRWFTNTSGSSQYAIVELGRPLVTQLMSAE